jgi:DNA-directed RNA polymerase specialized sigma24 family protein
MKDRLLVLRCKRGCAGAMAQIYQKYRKDLLILAVALLNDKAAAEDIVHDVFVSFAQTVARFRSSKLSPSESRWNLSTKFLAWRLVEDVS